MDAHNDLYGKLYDPVRDELNDEKILELLRRLPEMYENGELVETEDVCLEIAYAIKCFGSDLYGRTAMNDVAAAASHWLLGDKPIIKTFKEMSNELKGV